MWLVRHAKVRFNVAEGLPHVLAATDEVQDVLRHLVLNASEAMGTGGTIDISVDECELSGDESGMAPADKKMDPGTYVRVRVSDTGPGMAPEVAQRAFDPFFSTKFQGRGMGLAVVLGIMRGHKGAVRRQTAQNAGTCVELFFPARADAESAFRAAHST